MKTKIYTLLTAAVLAGSCLTASAQALHSGYFLEGYTFRHQLNPAFSAERNYISIPVLGNINIGTQGNVGLGTFLYPQNDQLVTFMHSSINGQEFLDGLKNNNRINANINLTLLSAGFKAWGGFNTIELGLRSNTGMALPPFLRNTCKAVYSLPKSSTPNKPHYPTHFRQTIKNPSFFPD